MTLADCDFLEEDTHNANRNPNTVGAKYTCNLGDGARTFYVLEAGTSSKPATLILEGNYDMETPAWSASGCYELCAEHGLEAKLDDIVEKSWKKLDRTQIGIPSAEKIMVADGQDEDAYLDYTSSLTNEWLYSYPENNSWGSSVPYGYWTATPSAGSFNCAWFVDYDGTVYEIEVGYDNLYGVRPIIILEA